MRKLRRSVMRHKIKKYLESMKEEARRVLEPIPTMRELRYLLETTYNTDKYGIVKGAKPNLRNLYLLTKGGI